MIHDTDANGSSHLERIGYMINRGCVTDRQVRSHMRTSQITCVTVFRSSTRSNARAKIFAPWDRLDGQKSTSGKRIPFLLGFRHRLVMNVFGHEARCGTSSALFMHWENFSRGTLCRMHHETKLEACPTHVDFEMEVMFFFEKQMLADLVAVWRKKRMEAMTTGKNGSQRRDLCDVQTPPQG